MLVSALAVGAGPLKSPATGIAFFAPNTNAASIAPGDAVCRRAQVHVMGLTTPMPSFLSPFQSPTTGKVFLPPNLNVPASAAPADAVCRSVQVVLPGSKVPTPSLP